MDALFPAPLQCLFEPKRYKVLWGGRGAGRCFARGTRVIMLDGTSKPVEDVKFGEYLLGPDSKPRRVLGTTVGNGPLFRIDQTSGGKSYTVNQNHILSLRKSHDVSYRPSRSTNGGTGTIQRRYPNEPDIVSVSVENYQKKSPKWKSYFFGYKAGFVDFGFENETLPIDPYFLGMWLGDGTSRELRLTVHRDDWEIIKYCEDYVARFDLGVSVCSKEGVYAYDVGFPKRTNVLKNELWQVFKRLGLDNDKHIPYQYLVAGEDARLAMLAGLIDSDGYMNNNGYEFCNTNKELALGAKHLADFLGFKTSLRIKTPNGRDRISTAYLVSINGDTWRIPSILPRKQIKESQVKKNKDFLLMGIKVVPVGEGDFFGFELDGDHLFMLEDGTVTHNSWGIARALLLRGTELPLRILCVRELQNSISESVHKLLSDQIVALGLEGFYEIQVGKIIGKNGTSFAFEGIKNNTTKIKSYEGIDICWAEEAIKMSRASWGILIPTIRKESSEIWMSFNPELDTDYTYQRFVLQADAATSSVVKMTWRDNPWFPDVLQVEMEGDRKRDYDYYLNVWEGHCVQMLEGAVYAKELRRATEDGRIGLVGYDREVPVDCYWDLGRADNTAIWFAQRVAMQFRVLAYFEDSGEDITYFLRELQRRGYVYGTMHLPHDARAKRLGSKRTIEELVRQAGYRVNVVPKLSITDGINAARIVFPNCWFDEKECADGLNSLRHYRYRVTDGHLSNEPLHDWASDGADAFRYLAVAIKSPRERGGIVERMAREVKSRFVDSAPGLGWMS